MHILIFDKEEEKNMEKQNEFTDFAKMQIFDVKCMNLSAEIFFPTSLDCTRIT